MILFSLRLTRLPRASSVCIVKSSRGFFFFFFFIKVLSTSEVQQISEPPGRDGFSAPRFTSNLKRLRAFLSLVFTQDCFFGEPGPSVTLMTNKTTSAVLILLRRLWRNGPGILSRQTAAPEVMDRPAFRHHYLQTEQNVSPAVRLFAFLSPYCLLPASLKGSTL